MPEKELSDDARLDAMLRELGAVEMPEDAADGFWQRLRPKLREHREKSRWRLPGRRWALASAAAVLVVLVLALAVWPRPFRAQPSGMVRRNRFEAFIPREYDPSLDFIVFRNGNVLAYQPAAIGGDLKMFLEALELFPARLQWLAVSGEQIQIGLDSSRPQTEPRPAANRGADPSNEMLCSQIHVFRSGPGASRPYVARVLALPGSHVHLDSSSAEGAPVRLSMSLLQVTQDACPVRVDLDYGSNPAAEIRKEMSLKLDRPACIGAFVAGKARCFVYVTVRRIPFVRRDLPAGT